jgi:valyl-tRNA synthetase
MSKSENISSSIPMSTDSSPSNELAKNFEPHTIEEKLRQIWAHKEIGQVVIEPNRKNFCIQLPPPNVTGTLHMGHALTKPLWMV